MALQQRRSLQSLAQCSAVDPASDRDPLAEFCEQRIPGACFFDIERISDPGTSLPHMLPSEAGFAAAADALGIRNEDTVVVYDRLMFSAPRAWWTWRVFGHQRVAVLDGGLPAWQAAGGALETAPADRAAAEAPAAAARAAPLPPARYRAALHSEWVRDWRAVLAALQGGGAAEQVVDARPAGRWRGDAPEPRPGLPSGHMPGSMNMPWDTVLAEDRRFKSPEVRGMGAPRGAGGYGRERRECGSGSTWAADVGATAHQPGAAAPTAAETARPVHGGGRGPGPPGGGHLRHGHHCLPACARCTAGGAGQGGAGV